MQNAFILRAGERGHDVIKSDGSRSSYVAGHPDAFITRESSFNFHDYQGGRPCGGHRRARAVGDRRGFGDGPRRRAALYGLLPSSSPPRRPPAQTQSCRSGARCSASPDVPRRRQRSCKPQLHVAYGNALTAARGFGAPETTAAFARARESASGVKDAPGRLAADWGLWSSSYVRGELPSMRAHAAALLSGVEARPDSPEAGVAHRAAGLRCWFAGEYREARDHFERALALFQPGRDDGLAFRFGHDSGVAAMSYLAMASWPLGEVDRAISLIDRMQTRIADLTHVGTLAFGRLHEAFFELMRGDHARAAPNAFELARLGREHDLPMWGAFGVFLEGLATAATGALGGGLDDMRRGVELLREQNVLLFDGLLKIALAEAEAGAGDPERAIAILDEALATCDRTGYRAFEAELHRARGEILLKHPANSAPAEEALPDRHRGREAARNAQLRTARRAGACEALSFDRPRRRRPRRPRVRARRLHADAGNGRDRSGAGAVGGYRGRRACEARIDTAMGWLSCYSE